MNFLPRISLRRKMKKVIPDTNVFLRFILNDLPRQADKAEQLFIKAKRCKTELYVPQIVIFEIQFVLDKYYGFSRLEIVGKLKTIISSTYLVVQDRAAFIKALDHYETGKIGFVDAFLIKLAEEEDAQMYSFDKGLSREYVNSV